MCVPSVWAQSIYIDKMKELIDSKRTAGIAIQYRIVQLIRVEGVASD